MKTVFQVGSAIRSLVRLVEKHRRQTGHLTAVDVQVLGES